MVYHKRNSVGFLQAKNLPLRIHEMIYIFGNKNATKKTYNPQMTVGKPYSHGGSRKSANAGIYEGYEKVDVHENISGNRYPTSVLSDFQLDHEKFHRTQKPIALCDWLVNTFTEKGDVVLDFCMGSGSSVISCIRNGRSYIGIEKDRSIFEIARKRIEENEKVRQT
jgi:DNA modification methylase